MKAKQSLIFVCISILLLASCKQKRQEVEELKIGVMSSMDFVPLAVAKEKGIFDKYGVKVDIQKFYSANDRDAAFQSGNLDGTVIDYTGAILQKSGGVDLKITSACNATFYIMTGPNSPIRSVKDLKGKKIAVSRNTVIDYCIEAALQSVGMSGNDIEKQEVNKIPIRLEMMINGQTDATALPDPFITIASGRGAVSIVSMEELGYSLTGFIFSSEAIKHKNKQIKAFYQSYNEAVEYIQTHSLNDIKSILINDIGFSPELVDSVKLPHYTSAEMPKDKDIQATLDWLRSKDLIPADFSGQDLLDSSFISK